MSKMDSVSKTVVLAGEFLEVSAERVRWSLTDPDGYTSYAEGRPNPARPFPTPGERFLVHLEMTEQGDVLSSRWEPVGGVA